MYIQVLEYMYLYISVKFLVIVFHNMPVFVVAGYNFMILLLQHNNSEVVGGLQLCLVDGCL